MSKLCISGSATEQTERYANGNLQYLILEVGVRSKKLQTLPISFIFNQLKDMQAFLVLQMRQMP